MAELNLYQKLLLIAKEAGVLQKSKEGYGYKYVPENEIQAKIKSLMVKYKVMLEPSMVEGSLQVVPRTYEKYDKKLKGNVTVADTVVSCEVEYIWTNTEKPSEQIVRHWAYIGQMDDAAQAFGAGVTYGNRYYLLKALQLATTEDDPDAFRKRQKESEEKNEVQELIEAIVTFGTELLSNKKITKEKMTEIIRKYNDNNGNPHSISKISIGKQILAELEKINKGDK